jgi:hypothetical protein
MTKHFYSLFISMILVLTGTNNAHAQKWVADTIYVSFSSQNYKGPTFNLKEVRDYRSVHPAFISVFEQKKMLFFPVDQIVHTQQNLSQSIENRFSNDTIENLDFKADIHEFYVKNHTSMGTRQLVLRSTIELSKIEEDSTLFFGTLYYSENIKQKKKIPIEDGYHLLIDLWATRFTSDVIAVDKNLDDLMNGNFYHFRRDQHAVGKNLYVETELFGGLNFWGIDAGIWFSEPESERIFNRGIGIMRYVNHPDFHAIAYGSDVRLWNYRFTEKWLFSNKMAFFMGINNWKNMATVDHKFEEIFYFNVSFTQRINFNTLDKSGFVFGAGLMEDVHYVIYHQPKIKLGLTLNLAYKF